MDYYSFELDADWRFMEYDFEEGQYFYYFDAEKNEWIDNRPEAMRELHDQFAKEIEERQKREEMNYREIVVTDIEVENWDAVTEMAETEEMREEIEQEDIENADKEDEKQEEVKLT